MTKYLAVDWDSAEVRFVLANLQRDQVVVLKTGSEPLETEDDASGQTVRHYGPTLKKLLRKHSVSRPRMLLGLGRSSLELINLEIPSASKTETPDLVVNQVLHDSPNFTEGQPLDFMLLPPRPGEMQRVIAATMTRTQLKQYRGICHEAGHKPFRIEFRPLALAELYNQSNFAEDKPILLLQSTADEADIVVLQKKKIIFTRSFKFPAVISPQDRISRIFSELSRTLAVVQQELAEDEELKNILIFGDSDDLATIREMFPDQKFEIEIKNPFQMNSVRAKVIPSSPGNYAALLGMILCESPGAKPTIDFLHPHEKPQPVNIARYAVLTILFLAVFITAAYLWNKKELQKLDDKLATLQKTIQGQIQSNQDNNPMFVRLNAAYNWDANQMIWLDELRDLSVRLPSEEDLVITGMQFGPAPGYVGAIDLNGRARDWSVIQTIRNTFTDNFHIIDPRTFNQSYNQAGGGYPWTFTIRIFCARRTQPDQFLAYLPEYLREQSQVMPDFNRWNSSSATPSTETSTQPTSSTDISSDSSSTDMETVPRQVFPATYQPVEKPVPQQITPPPYIPQKKSIPSQIFPPSYIPKS